MKAIRDAIGYSTKLRTTANQGMERRGDRPRAADDGEITECKFCEQPFRTGMWRGLKFARDNSPTPIMADESVHTPHDAFCSYS